MTLHQAESVAIVGTMLALFFWGALRHDLVALLALAIALIVGVVPPDKAFLGFSNPVIIIIASALVVSRSIAVSGIVERAARPLMRMVPSTSGQVALLTAAVAFLSAFMKNVGALGIFMPIAIQAAERGERSPSSYLMPLAFGSLIGGTITQVGTSPNLLISVVRQDLTGKPFGLFDFAPVGLPLTLVAVGFLAVGWRLIPQGRKPEPSPEKRFEVDDYLTEVTVGPDSPFAGKTVAEIEEVSDGTVTINAIIREGGRRYVPDSDWTVFKGDVLVLQADPATLKPFLDQGGLSLVGAAATVTDGEEPETAEAVVTADSRMVGQTPLQLHLRRRYEVNLLAIRRGAERIRTRLSQTRFAAGDVIVLQGRADSVREAITQLGCLPLAERMLTLGRERPRILPLAILLVAMALVGFRVIPVEQAFFLAAVLVVLLRLVTLKEAYDSIEWPIIVMLGALIPVGEAVRETGAAQLLGNALSAAAVHVPPAVALGGILLTSLLVTPFLHHAAAVLVMGPIAAVVAQNLGFAPEAFLMAVALGASCDFLTPIGHQNNLLVMGPGGYRFGDYWHLGLPLSCLVVFGGTPLILAVWPLRPGG